MFIAISIPFFGSLLGFLGGFALAPTTYFVSKIFFSYQLIEFSYNVLNQRLMIKYITRPKYTSLNYLIIYMYYSCSFPVSSGLDSRNLTNMACLGQLIGYVNYKHLPNSISTLMRLIDFVILSFSISDMHCYWGHDNDTIPNWCYEEYHPSSQELQVLLIN